MSDSKSTERFSWIFEEIVPRELHYEDCKALVSNREGCTCPALRDEVELVEEYKRSIPRRIPIVGKIWTGQWQKRLNRVREREKTYIRIWRAYE